VSGARPLRIALDLTQIDNQTLGSGQFRYAADLVNGLCAMDAGVELTLLGSSRRPAPEFRPAVDDFPGRCRYVELPPYRGRGSFYFDLARLSWRLATRPVDVFHQFHTNIPAIAPCPVVVTAYHYFEHKALFASRPHRYYRWALRHRADLVITISDATRDDFHRHLRVPLARMRTVHLGLSTSFASSRPAAGGQYLLSPYNLSDTKNLRSLILAWPAIAARHPALELILYGHAHVTPESEAAFESLVRGLAHADRIRRAGHVTDDVLAGLYEGCALFIFPTTVEGFGYPLLEAMAHGACCITRDGSAMKEVGGDAVCLVETLRPDEIASAAIELLDDPVRRAGLGQRAKRRAAQFTVDAMVRGTLQCYLLAAGASRVRPAGGSGVSLPGVR
jgi:glycosyltransferase involved in cell wall biosynthesis